MIGRRIAAIVLVFGALVSGVPASAGSGLPDDRARVDVTDGARAVVTDIDFRGRELRVIVPHRLAALDPDDAGADPADRIEIVIDERSIELDRAMTLSAAYAIARLRLEPRLTPRDAGARNRLADRSEFARVSGELRHMLELAMPRHPELEHRLEDLCELSCANAGLRVVADGLAVAALLLGRDAEPDQELRVLIGSLIEESVSAVALRVGVSCPDCDGSACVLEATGSPGPPESSSAS